MSVAWITGVIVAVVTFGFVPSIIAIKRKVKRVNDVCVLNLFSGFLALAGVVNGGFMAAAVAVWGFAILIAVLSTPPPPTTPHDPTTSATDHR